jgi:hypothetical protein
MRDDFFRSLPRTDWRGDFTPAAKRRSHTHFSVSLGQTLQDIEDELRGYRAKGATIELSMESHLIGYDGLPVAGAKPTDPGIVLRFSWGDGWLRLQCDSFDDWRANLRAIGLYLERMRLAKSYGIRIEGGWGADVIAEGTKRIEATSN